MDLLEYQAKILFRAVGIPVLPSQTIAQARDLKDLVVPYPVVLKSQVYAGGRGRLGGIRFVENTIDGIAAAQAIFNLSIVGEYPQVLLAEAKYDADQEFYLAVTLNPVLQRLVLLGSTQGGMAVQSAIGQIHQVVIEGEFSAFYARQLAMAMGLTGTLLNCVSEVVEKMYALLFQKDLDLVEINPLGVRGETEVMALDGKVSVNDAALARHPDLLEWRQTDRVESPRWQMPLLQKTLEPDTTLGILVNGAGLLMATIDQVYQAGGRAHCAVDIGGETHIELSPSQFHDRLLEGLLQLAEQPGVQQILVNLISGVIPGAVIFEALQAFDQALLRQTARLAPRRVVALAGAPPLTLELLLCCEGMVLPRSRPRWKRLTVTVYDPLAAAIDVVVNNILAD